MKALNEREIEFGFGDTYHLLLDVAFGNVLVAGFDGWLGTNLTEYRS